MITHSDDCLLQGRPIPHDLYGELRETVVEPDNGALLRQRLAEDGYLFLRNALPVDDVLTARGEVFGRLAAVGEIEEPAIDGIATGTSQREDIEPDRGKFWRSISEGSALRNVSHGQSMRSIMDVVLGEPSRPHDYIFLRPGIVGNATNLHYDHPFFARGSNRIHTVWTPLGDVPHTDGPLVVVDRSHEFHDLIEPVLKIDYDSNDSPQVQMLEDAISFARERKTRLLTADFRAGDVIIFSMTTLHGSLDNHSPIGRTRLSCDVRWQPAADPVDQRYCGPNPTGTTGIGYAELNGAKPLTEDWHIR